MGCFLIMIIEKARQKKVTVVRLRIKHLFMLKVLGFAVSEIRLIAKKNKNYLENLNLICLKKKI